ncbi:hypothetical protein Pmani_004817 [Petrolisthes manimaculis]|uniref:Uncharacterized protein n=1 Tax=Petrolisthes manimaculis TaxID=1843537 RepID=A0AAE1UI42_9EUCA|nr:hypothetical protein Pmani_004817 [Petrolisthes manimaculis]
MRRDKRRKKADVKLVAGTKVAFDNLFTSLDLLDNRSYWDGETKQDQQTYPAIQTADLGNEEGPEGSGVHVSADPGVRVGPNRAFSKESKVRGAGGAHARTRA